MNNNRNKKLIQRLISSQIGEIFNISSSFHKYYFHPTTNPYKLIKKFYTDFGYIEKIAFPKYHKYIIRHCVLWKIADKEMNYETAEIIVDEENDEYFNPFDWQYNVIKYDKTPFDIATLFQFNNAEFCIFWLKYILNKIKININPSIDNLHNIYFNTPPHKLPKDCDKKWDEILLISAINNSLKADTGCYFYYEIIKNICHWPSDQFRKIIKFVLDNVHYIDFNFLCRDTMLFCQVNNKQIGSDNYCIYVDEICQHRTLKNNHKIWNGLILHLIHHNGPFVINNLYKTIFYIIWNQHKDAIDILNATKGNQYLLRIFGRIGAFLKKYMKESDLYKYLENVEDHADIRWDIYIDLKRYHQFFLESLGFT